MPQSDPTGGLLASAHTLAFGLFAVPHRRVLCKCRAMAQAIGSQALDSAW
jgi:hypothetical protein